MEIRFPSDLYSGFAIDSALKVYADFAEFALTEEPEAFVVRLTATGDHAEADIADELANFALGATIEERQRARAG